MYVGAGPPALSSLDYAAAFAEVTLVGNAAISDADKLATYQYWSLGGGTSQPPGAWLQVALAVTTDHPLSLPEMARLFALTSMAMADTVAPTVRTKSHYHHWRPTTAIREAETDGNDLTDPDPNADRSRLTGYPEPTASGAHLSTGRATARSALRPLLYLPVSSVTIPSPSASPPTRRRAARSAPIRVSQPPRPRRGARVWWGACISSSATRMGSPPGGPSPQRSSLTRCSARTARRISASARCRIASMGNTINPAPVETEHLSGEQEHNTLILDNGWPGC